MDRIELFKELSLNDLREYDSSKAENLIGPYYDQFSGFCDFLRSGIGEIYDNEKDEAIPIVQSVSCNIDQDGIRFELKMQNGIEKEVYFSKEREKEFKEQREKEI